MSNSEIKVLCLEEMQQFTATTKLISKNNSIASHSAKPSKRYGHISFMYKGKLYVQGGYSNEGKNNFLQNPESKTNIQCINLQKQRVPLVQDKKIKKSSLQVETKWQIIQTKINANAEKQFQIFGYQAYCIFPHKKRLYMFGGSTIQGKTSNNLFRLDLDSLQWSKPEQKGSVPKARQDASMCLYTKSEKNYLVLYGGANYQSYQIFSDIHFYQIQTKFWFQCHNLSSNFIQPRLSPGICFNQNKIYVFGGYYLDSQLKKGYLNDLYEIQFSLSVEKGRPYGKSFARRLDLINQIQEQQKPNKPEKRCSTSLMFYKADYIHSFSSHLSKKQNKVPVNWLLLIGGQKSCEQKKKVTTLNDFWLFSLIQAQWRSINLINDFKQRSSFSSVMDKEINKIFIFGGLSTLESVLNDLVSVNVSFQIAQTQTKNMKIVQQEPDNTQLCYSQLNGLLLEQLCNHINFPFAAIGLIVDNYVNFQAGFCDLSYHVSKSKPVLQNYLKIQSNAIFNISNQILLSTFTCLKGGVRTYVQGTDKKIKAEMNKDNLSKQIGTNFILGGLRIGNQLVFINLDYATYEIQVIIILKSKVSFQLNKKKKQIQSDMKSFKIFSFVISRDQVFTENVMSYEKNSAQSKKRRYFFERACPQDSKQRVSMLIAQGVNTIKKGQVKNVLYISRLRTVDGQQCSIGTPQSSLQIFPDMLRNDLIYGDRQLVKQVESTRIPIYQCLDVSLKTYLSYLYSQNYQTQLTVSFHGFDNKSILVQEHLLKIDDLLSSKQILEISKQLEFDCKIIELYYFPRKQEKPIITTGKPQIKIFAHGTLFYHKSRLIKRHGIKLGEFLYQYKLRKINYQNSQNQKSIILTNSSQYSAEEIFGHIQLPDTVPVNPSKTQFLFPVMLQKIDQKLRIMADQVYHLKQDKRANRASKIKSQQKF